MARFITKFEFETKEISLYETGDEISGLEEYTKSPLRFEDLPIPLIDLTFTLKDGTQETGSFLFDSGADLTVLFNTPFAAKKNLKDRTGQTIRITARGLNKSTSFIKGSAEKLALGNYTFEDLPIDISESKGGISGSSAYDGLLGAKIINRFDMVLDYEHKMFYYKPNHKYDHFHFPGKC